MAMYSLSMHPFSKISKELISDYFGSYYNVTDFWCKMQDMSDNYGEDKYAVRLKFRKESRNPECGSFYFFKYKVQVLLDV